MTQLQADFKDFLSLLNAHRVEYLLIGSTCSRVAAVALSTALK